MKICTYCGQENEDLAARCTGCGTNGFKAATPPPAAPPHKDAALPEVHLRDVLADPVKLFRALVVVANAAFALALLAPYAESRVFSYEMLDLLDRNGEAAIFTLPRGIHWLYTLLYLPIAIGLYGFSAGARAAFAMFSVANAVLVLLGGISVASSVVGFLALVTLMADGAILVLAYGTPLKERFR